MNAFWHNLNKLNNFGDILTPYIIEYFTGTKPGCTQNGKHIIMAGSILQDANSDSVVLGAGYGAIDQKVTGTPDIRIVRGPITGELLKRQGFEHNWLYGDPGVIMPLLYAPKIQPIYDVGILPHYIDYPDFEPVSNVIDITLGVEPVIDRILQCRSLVTSSLHGLIVGQAYGIPTTLECFSDRIASKIKYDDYLRSIPRTDVQKVYNTIKETLAEWM